MNDSQINTCSCALKSSISPACASFLPGYPTFTWIHFWSRTEFTSFPHKPLALPFFCHWYFLLFSCVSYWAHFWAPTCHQLLVADTAGCPATFQEPVFQLWDGQGSQPRAKGPKVKRSMGLLEKVWLPDRKRAVERNCSFAAIPPGILLKSWEDRASTSVHLIKTLPWFPAVKWTKPKLLSSVLKCLHYLVHIYLASWCLPVSLHINRE